MGKASALDDPKRLLVPYSDKSIQLEESPGPVGGLTILTASVFLVGEMAGSGLLALPAALNDTGWFGMVLTVGCCFLSAYTGKVLGDAWVIVQDRYPEYRGHVRYPYPCIGQITYGKPGRYLVSFSINFTMFGGATVYLLIAADNLQSLISDAGKDISFCYWLLLIAAFLLPFTLLGTPKDFWFIAVGASISTSIASIVLFSNIVYDGVQNKGQRVHHSTPEFLKFFTAFGTICFAFGGHPAFPTFQTDMNKQRNFGKAVLIAYLIILAMYLPVSSASYFVFGDRVKANILSSVSLGPMLYIAQILITAHLLFGFIIVINPVSQELEEVLKIPKHFTWKRFLSRTAMVASVTFVAESIPHFSAILSLVGGSTLTLLAYVCPSLFYLKLCSMKGPWEEISVPLHIRVLNYEILAVGVLVGLASTYSAVDNLATTSSFTVPCYINATAANN